MEIKVKVFLLFCSLFSGIDGMTLDLNSTSTSLLREIEENHDLGIDCSIYSNSIETFIIEYKQMSDSLNIACQLHLKSAAGKLKSTLDEIVDQKLDKYIASVNQMRSKLMEMKKGREELQTISKLNEKYRNELILLNANLTTTIIQKTNLSELTEKIQIDLDSVNANFTKTQKNLTEELIKLEINNNQSTINFRKELAEMDAKLTNDTKSLKELMKEKENILNQTIVLCQGEAKSLETNFTKVVSEKNSLILEQNKTIISLIRDGNFSTSRKMIYLESIIIEAYDKNISNAENVIEFLNSFSDVEEIILGYRILFDQMIKNQHIYSTPTTTIAYRIFVDFTKKYENNENLIYLKQKLPQSLKNFPWNQIILIQNVKFNSKSIYTWYYSHNNLRMIPMVHTTITTASYLAHYFYPISNGKYFHIKSKYKNSYLFADINDFTYDINRRAVFGWRKANEIKETGRWQLEPIEGSQNFKIKNVCWNEYLSVAEDVKIHGYPRLFTLRSGKCLDDYCKWNFLKYTGN